MDYSDKIFEMLDIKPDEEYDAQIFKNNLKNLIKTIDKIESICYNYIKK